MRSTSLHTARSFFDVRRSSDRVEILAETFDVFDRRRRCRGMLLLGSAPGMESL
jgi:hypothetical protein